MNNLKKIIASKNFRNVAIIGIIAMSIILSSSIYLASALGIIDVIQIGDDGGFHIGRIQTIADDIRAGQFPDKMYMSMSAGMGYPAGIMYPDLFLYPFAVLRILGVPLLYCVVLFVVSINALTALIAYYSSKSFFQSRRIALVFSVLYTLSPYRLYCIFTRFASGELLALAFMPLIIVCLYNIITYNKHGETKIENRQWVGLALGMAGVIYSHVLSATIIVEFLCFPVIVLLIVKRDPKCLIAIFKSAGLCFLLTLAFIVPFLDYFIQFKSSIADGEMSLWFILNSPNRENYFSFNDQFRMGWVIYSALIFWPVICFSKIKKAINRNVKIFGWFLFGFALVFLVLIKSEFIWSLGNTDLPFISSIMYQLASIQFPWRLYGPMVLCLVFLMSVCLYLLMKYSQSKKQAIQNNNQQSLTKNTNNFASKIVNLIIALSIILSMIIAAIYPLDITRPNFENTRNYFSNYVPEADDLYLPEYDRWHKDTSFLNVWTPLEERMDKANPNVKFSNSSQSGTTIYTHVQNFSSTNQQVDIPLICYPYVKVIDANTRQEFAVEKDWWSSFINITLPPNYNGDLICGFVKPTFWTVAEIISLISLIVLIVSSTLFIINKQKKVD